MISAPLPTDARSADQSRRNKRKFRQTERQPGLRDASRHTGNGRWAVKDGLGDGGFVEADRLKRGTIRANETFPWMAVQRDHGAIGHRIFTARAARITTTVKEMLAWAIVSNFAQRDSTGTSVGEKAVLVLKARNR